MGLDAYVICNCVKQGRVKPPPFDIGLLEWTEYGIDLPDSVDDETCDLFSEWREHACEHEDFYYYYDRVYNISGGNLFYGIMEQLGQENFPLLKSIGEKTFTANQARKALEELDILESQISKIQGVFLIESKTQEEYMRAVFDNDRWNYSSSGNFTYELNERGFCIVDQNKGELFQSTEFSQELVRPEKGNKGRRLVRFRDFETGRVYESTYPLSKKIWGVEELYYPKSLQVLMRKLRGSDLRFIRVMRELCEASIQTGNPIMWA
ncbi:hypothetical protein YSY43_17380 [Paenibacillus sp. YSY-4.3]